MTHSLRIIATASGFGLLSCAALLAALYLFRAELYAQTEVVHAKLVDLYPVSEMTVSVNSFSQPQSGQLLLNLANTDTCTRWYIETLDQPSSFRRDSAPLIHLSEGVWTYRLKPEDCEITEPARTAIEVNISYGSLDAPAAAIQALDRETIQINRMNVPRAATSSWSVNEWIPETARFHSKYDTQAVGFLKENGYDETAPLRERIAFLASLVRKMMPDGSPPAYLNSLHPYDVLREAKDKGVGCFCRQWALVYVYLANIANMPSRLVFTGGADPVVDLGSHAFAETYVADEATWAYVDPTNDIALVTNNSDTLLNGVEIYNAITSGTTAGLTALTLAGETPQSIVSFRDVEGPVRHFMHRNNYLIFFGRFDGRYQMDPPGLPYYMAKLDRFLFQPQQYYGHVGFESYHWIRRTAFFGMIGFAAILVGSVLLFFARRTR